MALSARSAARSPSCRSSGAETVALLFVCMAALPLGLAVDSRFGLRPMLTARCGGFETLRATLEWHWTQMPATCLMMLVAAPVWIGLKAWTTAGRSAELAPASSPGRCARRALLSHRDAGRDGRRSRRRPDPCRARRIAMDERRGDGGDGVRDGRRRRRGFASPGAEIRQRRDGPDQSEPQPWSVATNGGNPPFGDGQPRADEVFRLRMGEDPALDQPVFNGLRQLVFGAPRRLDPARIGKIDGPVGRDARRHAQIGLIEDPNRDDVIGSKNAPAGAGWEGRQRPDSKTPTPIEESRPIGIIPPRSGSSARSRTGAEGDRPHRPLARERRIGARALDIRPATPMKRRKLNLVASESYRNCELMSRGVRRWRDVSVLCRDKKGYSHGG